MNISLMCSSCHFWPMIIWMSWMGVPHVIITCLFVPVFEWLHTHNSNLKFHSFVLENVDGKQQNGTFARLVLNTFWSVQCGLWSVRHGRSVCFFLPFLFSFFFSINIVFWEIPSCVVLIDTDFYSGESTIVYFPSLSLLCCWMFCLTVAWETVCKTEALQTFLFYEMACWYRCA